MTTDLAFRAPSVPLSMNKAKGLHWAALKGRLTPWHDAAWASCRNAIVRGEVATGRPVAITVELPFGTVRRRDPHNYTSTVVKAIVDGLKDAHLVPDDTPEWVTVNDPIIAIRTPPTVVVHIEERP